MSNVDPLDLDAQRASGAATAEQKQLAARQEAEDLKWLMADKRGRRYMWALLERTGIYRSSFTGNSETFFREGQRNIGLAMMDLLLSICPDRYAEMVKEQKQ
jgi:hypothetical protein